MPARLLTASEKAIWTTRRDRLRLTRRKRRRRPSSTRSVLGPTARFLPRLDGWRARLDALSSARSSVDSARVMLPRRRRGYARSGVNAQLPISGRQPRAQPPRNHRHSILTLGGDSRQGLLQGAPTSSLSRERKNSIPLRSISLPGRSYRLPYFAVLRLILLNFLMMWITFLISIRIQSIVMCNLRRAIFLLLRITRSRILTMLREKEIINGW